MYVVNDTIFAFVFDFVGTDETETKKYARARQAEPTSKFEFISST